MVSTKAPGVMDGGPVVAGVTSKRTFGAGYIAPHPSIRKDAVDVDNFLQEHQVYTAEYLESVQPVHRTPSKAHEYAAWYWHVAARTLVDVLSGTLGMGSGVTEHGMGQRILLFTSVGTVHGLALLVSLYTMSAGAVSNHLRSILTNKPDNGWVRTAVANAECVRVHSGIVAAVAWSPHKPPLWARLFHIIFQVVMFFQLLLVYCLLPSVALAYDAYRAEEQVFNYSQAISLIDSGRFKRWKTGTQAPGLAVYYALPEGSPLRDVLLRMRADEASVHYIDIVLADLPPLSKNPFIIMERVLERKPK